MHAKGSVQVRVAAVEDPFRDGTYQTVWTDEGLELEFVNDYINPNRYEHKFIELRQ